MVVTKLLYGRSAALAIESISSTISTIRILRLSALDLLSPYTSTVSTSFSLSLELSSAEFGMKPGNHLLIGFK